MNRLRLVAALATVVATTALGLLVASPAQAAQNYNTLQNETTGLCLQPVDGSHDQGVAIVQEICDESNPAQFWTYDYLDSTFTIFRVRNMASQLCLDARGGNSNGTPIQQWPCNNISNEKFDSGPNFIQLRSRVSNTSSHCVDVPGGAWMPGLAMQLYKCNTTGAQIWNPGIVIIT